MNKRKYATVTVPSSANSDLEITWDDYCDLLRMMGVPEHKLFSPIEEEPDQVLSEGEDSPKTQH